MAMMVFLACGEDPNFGPYSNHVRRAIRSIIKTQDPSTGIMGPSMYHHGFATLALAEAYGVVDERGLWPDGKAIRTIGQALELAVRAAVTSQKKNPLGAWRYSPERAMPTPRSAVRSSWGCWRPATQASKCPTSRSTRQSRSTPR